MQNLQSIRKTIADAKPLLAARFGLSAIALFGSVTRPDFQETSDVDILAEFSKPVGMEFIALADELERLIGRRVDLVSVKGLSKRNYDAISPDLQYV